MKRFGRACAPVRNGWRRSTRGFTTRGFCDFTRLISSPSDSFHAIVAGEFIERLPPHQVDTKLCEFFRVLRPRARLLLTTPNPCYFKNF